MKILLSVDGSPYTKRMLAYLATHLETFSPANDFTVFTVQPPLPPHARSVVGKEAVQKYHSEEAEKVLSPVIKFLMRHDIHAKSSWKVGHVGETIAKFAESNKYEMVVMGSHGHGGLMKLVMGSVATQVLAQCHVPVLMVR